MEKITITKALKELTILDNKINKSISSNTFVTAAKTKDTKVNASLTKEQFAQNAKAAIQSVKALMNRREIIRSAVVQSNAETLIEICGETMSVAKAMDLKTSIKYKKFLLERMEYKLEHNKGIIKSANKHLDSQINDMIATSYGVKNVSELPEEDLNKIIEPYKKNNESVLLDPLNIKEKIEHEKKYIEEFESKIDLCLQVSNCTTFIEI